LPARVIFGAGRLAEVGAEAARLGMARPLVITGAQQSALGRRIAEEIAAAHFDQAAMHTPTSVTDQAMALVAAERIDGTIAIGGGSAIGLGKAIAWRRDLPQIAVPTTYAGSEMTDILGETADGAKTTRRDPKIQPETVIYDPELTRSLAKLLAATSGINAIAHAVEALYAKDGNPVTAMMAEEGIRALASALPRLDDARGEALYGAWLCGAVLGTSAMALHHKLCHVLGGSFGMPHAETHTVILPHATAYNAAAAPKAMARIARALGKDTAAGGLFDLAHALGAPVSLEQLGFRQADIARAAEIAVANPYWNPRGVTREGVLQILTDAFHGRRPQS
jgi:alcohol dehydrogenase class IV